MTVTIISILQKGEFIEKMFVALAYFSVEADGQNVQVLK